MIPSGKYQECIRNCVKEIYQDIGFYEGTILIAGATGLIGSTFVDCVLEMNDEYATKFKLIAIAKSTERATERLGIYFARTDFHFVSCDVNIAIPEIGKVDYIIHAASNTHPMEYSTDPIGTIKTNVAGTDNLLYYAVTHYVKKFVFLSSVEIYGENIGQLQEFGEKDFGYLDCNQLRSGYPESKRVGESLCCAYGSKYGINIIIPRLCRVYGPTMWLDDSKALAQFIKKAISSEDIILKSTGQQYYSYIHVIDAVKAIFCIMDRGKPGEAYNVSSKMSNIKLIDLANKLARISGTKVAFSRPDKIEKQGYSSVTKAVLNNKKLKSLGWKETYDIDSGLRMTVQILRSLKGK